jgi:UDP-N-acetylglucosamine 4,6-dehydratase/5-epimerase
LIKDKKIFITGGAGFLGNNIVKKYYNDNEITIYSRDESKHYYLKKEFPKIKCIIGDIRNFDLLKRASKNHDIGIFAASLKQIGAVDQNYEESVRIIIDGAINSRRCAEENEMKSACFISSDKSRAATTLYGSMKFVAGELFIVNAEQSSTNLSCAIYGNVVNSTGSIIPLIWDSIDKKYSLTLYSDQMTRFMLNVDRAIDVIENALKINGYNVIPNVKSFFIKDLFDIYQEKFKLKYVIGEPRISEKIHEIMIAKEELPRTSYSKDTDNFLMHYRDIQKNNMIGKFINEEYCSKDHAYSKKELYEILEKNNFYR